MDWNELISGEGFFLTVIIAASFAVVLAIFLAVQAGLAGKARRDMAGEFNSIQAEISRNMAKALTQKLAEYTDTVLAEKIRAGYADLIAKDMMPAVNSAAEKIAGLAEASAAGRARAEAELSDFLSGAFSAATKQYFDKETEAIKALEAASGRFEEVLAGISGHMSGLTAKTEIICGKAEDLVQAMTGLLTNLSGEFKNHIAEFSGLLEKILTAVDDARISAGENAAIYGELNITAKKIGQLTADAASMLAGQNGKTAALLDEASLKLGMSSEAAAQAMITAASGHSDNFSGSIKELGETFATHMANLQIISQQLANSVKSFKDDSDASSAHFITGIEKTVASALEQMDKSLAEIVERIASAAVSVQEAADSLPRAVKSMNERA